MAVLGEGAPKTQRELVAKTRMDKVTVNRAAKALADRQLIRRQAHEADGRSHHLELTETGWSLSDAIVPAALATEERLESHLSGTARQELMAVLAKMINPATDYDLHRLTTPAGGNHEVRHPGPADR